MRIYLFAILLLFTNVTNSYTVNQKLINKIIKATNLKPNEKVIIIFSNISNCYKCVNIPLSIINRLEPTQLSSIKLLAFVRCSRDLELERFKKIFHWEYTMLRDDGTIKNKLNLDNKDFFVIMNFKGKILLKYKDLQEIDLKEIQKIILKK